MPPTPWSKYAGWDLGNMIFFVGENMEPSNRYITELGRKKTEWKIPPFLNWKYIYKIFHYYDVHLQKLAWKLKETDVWKMVSFSKWVTFRFQMGSFYQGYPFSPGDSQSSSQDGGALLTWKAVLFGALQWLCAWSLMAWRDVGLEKIWNKGISSHGFDKFWSRKFQVVETCAKRFCYKPFRFFLDFMEDLLFLVISLTRSLVEIQGFLFARKHINNMDVSKNRGKTPKMDGENNGKPY